MISGRVGVLQSALYVAVACALAAALLSRLLVLSEAAEKAAMEATLGRVQGALYVKLAQAALTGAQGAAQDWTERNPFVLAEAVPANYAGELHAPDLRELARGQWYYDTVRREVVYLLRQSRAFAGDGSEPPNLRFRLEVERGPGGGYRRVTLRSLTSYVWEP
ncbi:MAG: hypothetical protein IPK29_16090 [Betaproteobacteria bacterium]|nr:hypothetical protein [Betaproteobacteria bacterium]